MLKLTAILIQTMGAHRAKSPQSLGDMTKLGVFPWCLPLRKVLPIRESKGPLLGQQGCLAGHQLPAGNRSLTGCPLGPALLRSTSYARIVSIGGRLSEAPHFHVAHPSLVCHPFEAVQFRQGVLR
jgi:hypothetical protein